MASYPGAKVHRVNRRKLGRGQSVPRAGTTVALTASTTTVTLTFASPVIVSGVIPVVYNGGAITIVSQTQTSPTVVTQTVSASAASATYSLANQVPQIRTPQGGRARARPARFNADAVYVVTAVNNGDGTYTFVFSQAVTFTGSDNQLWFNGSSPTQGVNPFDCANPGTGDTFDFDYSTGAADCDAWLITGIFLEFGGPVQAAFPQYGTFD